MKNKSHMLIKEFSYLTGIKKENLRFYDQSGLLCPEIRGENGYRYYSRHQLNTAYLISDLRELKLGLPEIKEYSNQRTPESILALFSNQEKKIKAEIEHLKDISEIMSIRNEMVKEALDNKNTKFIIRELTDDPIFLCPVCDPALDEDEKSIKAYEDAFNYGINLSYPLGVIISNQQSLEGTKLESTQYYFKTKRKKNTKINGGRYAIAYGQCNTEKIKTLCQELIEYIHTNQLDIQGDFYTEWLLDELANNDNTDYFVSIRVKVK